MTKEIQEWFKKDTIANCLAEYEKQELGLVSDIAKHGCSGGVPGLVYYSETTAFHAYHQGEVWSLLTDHADEAGIQNGNMLTHISRDPTSLTTLVNDLVWWAVEIRAQELVVTAAGAAAGEQQ